MAIVKTKICLRCREIQICDCPGNAIWIPVEMDYEELRKLLPRGERAIGKPIISADVLAKHIKITEITTVKDK